MSHLCSGTTLCLEANWHSTAIGWARLPYSPNSVVAPRMPFGSDPCPVLISSCSCALSGSLWQALSEFRPKRCQTCAETAGELQPCSWFWPCSYFWSKFILLFSCTNQCAERDHRPSDSSLHSSNSHMQDKALEPQKEQHSLSYPVGMTHVGKPWGTFQ